MVEKRVSEPISGENELSCGSPLDWDSGLI